MKKVLKTLALIILTLGGTSCAREKMTNSPETSQELRRTLEVMSQHLSFTPIDRGIELCSLQIELCEDTRGCACYLEGWAANEDTSERQARELANRCAASESGVMVAGMVLGCLIAPSTPKTRPAP